MNLVEYKKWLAIGTGVGIEIGPDDLHVTVARIRPSGVSILGSLVIHRFREQPAAEWGAIYASFLRKLGQRHLAAQVLLPREAVVVRQVQLPGVADKDLAAALKYQIDSLHPFQEDEVIYDHARIGKTSTVLVGIARRKVVDQYATLLSEAGIKISAFTFSAATLYSSVRMLNQPPADGFVAFGEAGDQLEAYGESPARPVFSARLDATLDRARTLALSELRLPPETEPVALTSLLPLPLAVPDDYDLNHGVFLYATAIAGACPWLSLSSNLLPPELRKSSNRLIYVPSIVLSVMVVIMTIVLSAYSTFEDKRYLNRIQVEIQRMQPQAQLAANLDRKIALTRNRAQALDNFRTHLKDDMNALNDLSGILVPPAWLTSLHLTRDSLSISGEAERAEGLLKLLDNSKQFRRSEFTLPIAHGGSGENFSLHSAREGVAP